MVYELTHYHQDDSERDTEQDNGAPASEKALRVFRHMGMLHARNMWHSARGRCVIYFTIVGASPSGVSGHGGAIIPSRLWLQVNESAS
jgi:hypothetical protein